MPAGGRRSKPWVPPTLLSPMSRRGPPSSRLVALCAVRSTARAGRRPPPGGLAGVPGRRRQHDCWPTRGAASTLRAMIPGRADPIGGLVHPGEAS